MCQNNNNTKKREFQHLNYEHRRLIEKWYNKEHKTKSEISRLLSKTRQNIILEIKKGLTKNLTTDYEEIEVYSADIAEEKYQYNLRQKGPNLKIGNDYELVKYIENGIKKERKSPEILVEEIERKELKFKNNICPKTIRNAIKTGEIFDIKPKDMIYKKIWKSKNKDKRICEKVPAEKSIEFRPKEVETREEYGHWEGDLVIGTRKKGAVLFTLTERKTREEIIIKLPSKETANIAKAFDRIERRYGGKFYQKFKTITFDNGVEFRGYKAMEKAKRRVGKRFEIYYAHPYCSGERGSNENNNRLIRSFITKGTEIDNISDNEIKDIENWINNLPRPMFKFKTSLEMAA
jgi:IS30 family transposase